MQTKEQRPRPGRTAKGNPDGRNEEEHPALLGTGCGHQGRADAIGCFSRRTTRERQKDTRRLSSNPLPVLRKSINRLAGLPIL